MTEIPISEADGAERVMLNQLINAMLCMTAACILAGTIFGEMTLIGIESTNRNRRKQVLKIIDANFSVGIGIALSAGARLAHEQGAVN